MVLTFCPTCKTTTTVPHCPPASTTCTWRRCKKCKATIDPKHKRGFDTDGQPFTW